MRRAPGWDRLPRYRARVVARMAAAYPRWLTANEIRDYLLNSLATSAEVRAIVGNLVDAGELITEARPLVGFRGRWWRSDPVPMYRASGASVAAREANPP